MGKAGRSQNVNISDNNMLAAIENYTKSYPNESINIKKLAEVSGIDRHYWYSRKGFKEKIEDINTIHYSDYDVIKDEDKNLFKLPDIESIVENNYKNKRKLKTILSMFINSYQEFYDSSCEAYKMKKDLNILRNKVKMYEEKIEELKFKNKELEKLNAYNENRYYERAVRSHDSSYRRENDIKKDVIKLEHKNLKTFSTNDKDIDSLLNSIKDS